VADAPMVRQVRRETLGVGVVPPLLILFYRLSVSTSFVLAALRALHVDASGAVEVRAGTEELGCARAAAGGRSVRRGA
jgi:hypothetical protein